MGINGGINMLHKEVNILLEEIRKNKNYNPTAWETNFLNDLSFYATMQTIKISEKQSKTLQEIYRKSQEKL